MLEELDLLCLLAARLVEPLLLVGALEVLQISFCHCINKQCPDMLG